MSEKLPESTPAPASMPLVLVFLLILVATMMTESQRWDASILDRFESRQVQTAMTAYWINAEGFRLDYLTPLFGPPWSIPMEFPTYQLIVAKLSQVTGLHLEQAGRLVSILFFLAMLPAAFDLLGRAGLSPSRRLLALAVVLTTPVYLFYTRTVMMETTALCFSVWFLCLFCRGLGPENPRMLAGAGVFAVLAALTKITTFTVYCVPAGMLAAVYAWRALHSGVESPVLAARRRLAVAALPVGLALVAAWWWIARSDAVKLSNPFTTFLTSAELRDWNFGAFPMRFEAGFWKTLQDNVTRNLLSEGALALTLFLATLATSRARWVALVCLAGFFSGPLIYANLYHVHDYYYTANALLLTGAAGIILASAWDNPRLPRVPRWAAVALVVALQINAFDRGYHYYYHKAAPPPPGLAAIIRQATPPEGVLLISGADWDPTLPYYSQRRAFMIPHDRDDESGMFEEVISRLPPRKIAAMVMVGDARNRKLLIRSRIAQFGLAPLPFASTDNADLYLTAESVPAAAAAAAQSVRASDTRILVTTGEGPAMPGGSRQELNAQDFPMCSPAPLHARSRFGVSPIVLSGQLVVGAHAPSELYFQPPPQARHIAATVGLVPSSYAKLPPEASDGIVVEIFEQQPDGLRRSLLRRTINPVVIKADRGPQEITFESAEPLVGQLIFSVDPGRKGDNSYDQAYWSKIEIR